VACGATSFAQSIAPADHWHLVDLVAVVSSSHKEVGSTGGHSLAPTSPLQNARISDTPRRLDLCRSAIQARDFAQFAAIVEQDALIMHGVMMSSVPSLVYWLPATVALINAVREWRSEGISVCFTIDAGPNVHIITEHDQIEIVRGKIAGVPGVSTILEAHPGGPVQLID
jgi:diphosphomevalonate decarboxylase